MSIDVGAYAKMMGGDASEDQKPKKSIADKLVELAAHVEFFHQDVDEPFASVHVGNHIETRGVQSRGFKQWLSREFYLQHQKIPGSQALQDALNVLTGRAIHDGKQISVHTRVAEHAGRLYLDLTDADWRAIEITSAGWSIVSDVPVKFVRTRGMLPIPEPVHGGSLDELHQFLNISNNVDFALIKAFLISTVRPNLPFPLLVLTGEQGSGKTSLSVKLKSIVDPAKAPVRSFPRESRDLAIAAGNGWLLAFDNVSTIPAWMSDDLCRLSTGGGLSTRELYSNGDEKIFDYMRPAILNGIGDIVTRPDLLDRCLVLQLPVIPEERRRQESELNHQFEEARPRILGALLDAGVVALSKHSSIRFAKLPRMADFAVWGAAAESAHSRESVFLDAYVGNRAGLNHVAIDASVIGPPILQLMEQSNPWEGTVAELLQALNGIVSDGIKHSKLWPAKPRTLSNEIRRIAPNLRAEDIEVTFGKHTHKGTPVRLVRKSPSVTSAQSDTHKISRLQPDALPDESTPSRQPSSGAANSDGSKSFGSNRPDDADDTDALFCTQSKVKVKEKRI
jgi:hypothetical protein